MGVLQDFKVGETVSFSLQYDGVDLSGHVFHVYLRADLTSPTNDLEFSTTAGDHAGDDPTNGYVVIEIPATATASLAAGSYYYQIMAIDGAIKDVIAPVGCLDTVTVCATLEV